jgi:D-alanyl-lipoteichoic acid acyltransferase DltB (MBOAT superfamily)
MLFHTWIFVAFFAVFYPVFLLTRRTRLRDPWLLISSYTFYGWWNPLYLVLIAWSTAVDYAVVGRMAKSGKRRSLSWLWVSVANNLLLLGFFKYGAFVADNISHALAAIGIPYAIPAPGVLLPVGISFYVFQSMSYTIDFYRGRIERETSFIRYATFVSLFPQLVAGPIERAGNLLRQLRQPLAVTWSDVADGLSLFTVGLFKKVALADALALYVDPIYDVPEQASGTALLVATVAFGWQIYFDFSGYTDMARGLGRLIGLRFMLNFNNPYLATSLGDFWQRWHISLSTWFKDYVYVPLGGNRGSSLTTYRNIALTMLLSGLWHGAAWTFVIWGALHALGRFATRELERTTVYRNRVPRPVKQLLVFAFVTFTWIFFRAANLDDAMLIVMRIVTGGWTDPLFPILMLALVGFVWLYQFAMESRVQPLLHLAPVRVGLATSMAMYLLLFASGSTQPFIYFQF